MAKLNKEKFTIDSSVIQRTTSSGHIELYLYYDTTYHNFYFDIQEIKEYINTNINSINFRLCKTRDEAIFIIEKLILESVIWERKIRIELTIDEELITDKTDLINNLTRNCNKYNNNILQLEFKRLLVVDFNGNNYYKECSDKWNPKDSIYSTKYGFIIDYSEETELFLISIQSQIKNASRQVIDFFNVQNEEVLSEKIKNNQNILKLNQNNEM